MGEPVVYPLLPGAGPARSVLDALGAPIVSPAGTTAAASGIHGPDEHGAVDDYLDHVRFSYPGCFELLAAELRCGPNLGGAVQPTWQPIPMHRPYRVMVSGARSSASSARRRGEEQRAMPRFKQILADWEGLGARVVASMCDDVFQVGPTDSPRWAWYLLFDVDDLEVAAAMIQGTRRSSKVCAATRTSASSCASAAVLRTGGVGQPRGAFTLRAVSRRGRDELARSSPIGLSVRDVEIEPEAPVDATGRVGRLGDDHPALAAVVGRPPGRDAEQV